MGSGGIVALEPSLIDERHETEFRLGRQQLEALGVVKELPRITADDTGIEPAHRTPEPESLGAVQKKGGSGKTLAFVNREVAGIGDGLCQNGSRELL